MACTLELGTTDAELADRAAAPDGDGVAVLDIGEVRALPPCWKDIGQEQDLLIGQAVGDDGRANIRIGNSDILRLATGIAAGQMGIAEQTRSDMAEHLDGVVGGAIGTLADRPLPMLAEPAFTAAD